MSSLFPAQFTERLRMHKYAKWVVRVEFSEAHLGCLLWMIGEFSTGAQRVLELLHEPHVQGKVSLREYVALQALQCMVRGERFSAHRWVRCIGRQRAWLELHDLPEAVRAALQAAAPDAGWKSVLEISGDYELVGADAGARPLYAYVSAEGAVTYLGGERQKGQLKSASLIPATLDETLGRSKETAWAAARGFPEEALHSLFGVLNEFDIRSSTAFELLEQAKPQLAGEKRAVLALQAISCMVRGERFDTGEYLRRVERGRAHLEYDELPAPLRAVLERAAPGVAWGRPKARPDCHVLEGARPGRADVTASVYPDGKVVFRRVWIELPPALLSAVESHLPGYKVLMAHSVGAALDAVDEYELALQEPQYKTNEKFVMRADGSGLRRCEWVV